MYLLVCVLDNPALLASLLDDWTEIGVRGITVIDSTGVQRMREHREQSEAPLLLGFSRLLPTDQYNHITLFAVVSDMETVQRAVGATAALTGDLSQPHTGVLFAVPVTAAWGLPKHYDSSTG